MGSENWWLCLENNVMRSSNRQAYDALLLWERYLIHIYFFAQTHHGLKCLPRARGQFCAIVSLEMAKSPARRRARTHICTGSGLPKWRETHRPKREKMADTGQLCGWLTRRSYRAITPQCIYGAGRPWHSTRVR